MPYPFQSSQVFELLPKTNGCTSLVFTSLHCSSLQTNSIIEQICGYDAALLHARLTQLSEQPLPQINKQLTKNRRREGWFSYKSQWLAAEFGWSNAQVQLRIHKLKKAGYLETFGGGQSGLNFLVLEVEQ
jgi:hypothetical protein